MPVFTLVIGPWNAGPAFQITQTSRRSLRLLLEDPSELTITLPGDSPQAKLIQELITDAWLLCDGDCIFRGRCVVSSDSLSVAYSVDFTFKDYRYVLDRRIVYSDAGSGVNQLLGSYTNVEQVTILKALIDYTQAKTGGNMGITYDSTSMPNTGVLRTLAPAPLAGSGVVSGIGAGDKIGSFINSLAKLSDGFDWDVLSNPNDTGLKFWIWYPGRGTDRGVTLDYGGSATDDATRNFSDETYANAIWQSGGEAQSPIELDATDIAVRPEGRWDAPFDLDPALSTAASVAAKALYNLQISAQIQPGYTWRLRNGFWQGPNHLFLGDTVAYVVNRGRLQNVQGSTRVFGLDIDLDQSDIPSISITIGQPKKTLLDSLKAMRSLLSYLHSR